MTTQVTVLDAELVRRAEGVVRFSADLAERREARRILNRQATGRSGWRPAVVRSGHVDVYREQIVRDETSF